jgi:signal transduction histidine kinase
MNSLNLIILAAGLFAWLNIAAVPAHAVEEEAHVLMLNGLDPDLPAYRVSYRAMQESLANETPRRVVFFSESLDSQRFSMRGLEPAYLELFTQKYRALHIDVVVAVSQAALEFFKRYGERLWPGARMIYVSSPGEVVAPAVLPAHVTGVESYLDVEGTIDLARRLQPDARRILVISGASDADKLAEQLAQRALSARPEKETVEYLSGLPLPELIARVAGEPADTIVLYLAQFRDRAGRPYVPREVLRAISDRSAAPVYSATAETYVGFGMVAGNVEMGLDKGRLIGDQVRAALAGEPSDPSRVLLKAPIRCVADARLLKHWSLDERRLPPGCEIRFADRASWREYFWQALAALMVIAGQAILIAALLVQRRRRRVAEQSLQRHLIESTHTSRLATAGELTASIAHELNQPLAAILSNAETGEFLLQSDDDQRDMLRHILADIRRDNLRASAVIRRLRDLLAKHEIEHKPLDLNATVTEVGALLRVEAERRRMRIEIRQEAVPNIVGDRIQIQQVLINLLLNAMDAVVDAAEERRTIIMSVTYADERVRITVRDLGQGIATGDLPKVFDSFYSTKRAGMGLGLAITRTIVQAHHGHIWVESRPGDGAEFHVEFPTVESVGLEVRTADAL